MEDDGRALTPGWLSIVAVFVLFFFTPLYMGFSMTAAVLMVGEDTWKTTPDDGNGFQWVEGGNCTVHPAVYSTVSSMPYGNFTMVGGPTGIPTGGGGCSMGVYEIGIPVGAFLGSGENLSSFMVEAESYTYSTQTAATGVAPPCSSKWIFDGALKVNGSVVITERSAESHVCIDRKWYNSSGVPLQSLNWQWSWVHEVNAAEAIAVADALDVCESTCNVTVRISNLRVAGSGSGYVPDILADNNRWRVQTSISDGAAGSFLFNLSAWILGAIFLLVAVASTPLWNPFKGVVSEW